jgi:hypothetical protein
MPAQLRLGANHPDLSNVAIMDWVQGMTAAWVRILSAAGGGDTPLEEAVRQISRTGGAPEKKKGVLGRRQRNAATPAEALAVTVLSRQLIAGVLVGDLMVDQLCALTGQSRGQLLDHLSGSMPGELRDGQLRALQAELSGSCAPLRDPERATYAGLGDRIEQLLRLAEEQASALIDAARAEAAGITASAGPPQSCPRCGGTLTEPEVTAVRTQTAPPE